VLGLCVCFSVGWLVGWLVGGCGSIHVYSLFVWLDVAVPGGCGWALRWMVVCWVVVIDLFVVLG